jgi:hypothetical protein
MHTVAFLPSATVDQVRAIAADYIALDQARVFRRLFVRRFGALAAVFGVAGFGFHWLSPAASWVSVAACGIAPAWAWLAELRFNRRLAQRMSQLPDGTAVRLTGYKKVIKSS